MVTPSGHVGTLADSLIWTQSSRLALGIVAIFKHFYVYLCIPYVSFYVTLNYIFNKKNFSVDLLTIAKISIFLKIGSKQAYL